VRERRGELRGQRDRIGPGDPRIALRGGGIRAALGAEPILTAVGIDTKMVSFATNIRDTTLGKVFGAMPATSSFSWSLQFGHFQRFITARIVDILGRGGLNHGGVANDVGRGALAEGLGLNLFAQECYEVLAGGAPSGTAPLG